MNQALLEMFNNGSLEQLKDKYVEDKSWIDWLISISIGGFQVVGENGGRLVRSEHQDQSARF